MSEYPEDVMKAARDASLLCIGGMCSTYRHDYGLLPENERKALYVTMSQLAYHDVAPVIARAIMAERKRGVEICEAEREWGGIIRDVQDRIASGQGPRQIPGWNCEYKDDD